MHQTNGWCDLGSIRGPFDPPKINLSAQDPRPEYARPLGGNFTSNLSLHVLFPITSDRLPVMAAPLGDGIRGSDGVWRRSFSSGTTVIFANATGGGPTSTIAWADSHTKRGFPTNQTAADLRRTV